MYYRRCRPRPPWDRDGVRAMKAVKYMKRRHNRSGFTMAELLIVVAIIAVLSGVAFIAVQNHQRGMEHLECDAIAKEIFVAAQNHLTMAESQGYLGITPDDYGTAGTEEGDQLRGVYYLVNGSSSKMLELMLPFGSIDETVRSGGSYLIRYQPKPAMVLDVFYCTKNGRYKHVLSGDEYATLLGLRDTYSDDGKTIATNNRDKRRNFGSAVLGWYGGAGTLPSGEYLDAPVIEVENAERLIVRVTDINAQTGKTVPAVENGAPTTPSLKLIVVGEKSGARLSVALYNTVSSDRIAYDSATNQYTVTLDDITAPTGSGLIQDGLHFADLNKYAGKSNSDIELMAEDGASAILFIPGENITVSAVAYSNDALTNIAYGNEETTNSLFADYDGTSTAYIGNIRHLENLDKDISGIVTGTGANNVNVTTAQQIADLGALPEPEAETTTPSGGGGTTDLPNPDDENEEADLSWTGFIAAVQKAKNDTGAVKVYGIGDTTGTAENCYRPVSPDFALEYMGNGHSITNVTANETVNPAGLFGAPTAALKVSDLVLYDFDINGSNAGALVGTLPAGSAVTNVLAYHGEDSAKGVTATASAGGLIGSMAGGEIKDCAAALVVAISESSTSGDAGGLIGTVTSNGKVTGCYAGGHTDDGAYSSETYNVTGYNNAGGLIGNAGSAQIEKCYATCSAECKSTSGNVGGLVGGGSGNITDCYATGLVAGADGAINIGAFAGNYSGIAQRCSYFEAVNPGLPATGNATTNAFLEIDADYATYKAFVAGPHVEAKPYDAQLSDIYTDAADGKVKFNLKDIAQLGETLGTDKEYFVATHYGDWPVPGIQVQNTAAGTP